MKIKAFNVQPEYQDSTLYFDFNDHEDFIIDGNSRLKSYNTNYSSYSIIVSNCIEDYCDLLHDINNAGRKNAYYKNASEAIRDYLDFKPTKSQVHKIKEALSKINYQNMNECIAELLSIYEQRTWDYRTIRGFSQSDWQTIFYPTDKYNDDFIQYVESVYFNTGEEYIICTDSGENYKNPYDYTDAFYSYFAENVAWDHDALKRKISEITGTRPEDVTIYEPHEIRSTIWEEA